MERKTYTEHLFRIGKKYMRVTPEGPEEYRRVAEKVYNSLKNIEFELEDGLYFDASIGDYIETYREETPYGIKCDTKPLYGSDCPNYVYDPSGTGFVLTRLYEISGEEKYLVLAKELAEYLMNLAVQTGDGKLIPYILGEEETIFSRRQNNRLLRCRLFCRTDC